MAKTIKIAIDGMGGDDGATMVVHGLSIAKSETPNLEFILFGRDAILVPLIAEYKNLSSGVTIIHTDDYVAAEDKPSQAVRRGRKSSMGLAIAAVKDGSADVAVSAGNTGALMSMAKIMLRTMPAIDRPALTSRMPTLTGECVLLDLGANVDCNAENLVQFAVMGAAFSRTVVGVDRPKVGILNVGVEELKGSSAVKEASQCLRETHPNMEFNGFAEGNDIGTGKFDVIVTDGFSGNIALKTIEGTAKFVGALMKNAFESSISSKLGYLLAKGGINDLKAHIDPNNHNGAVFLGLNGLVVKSHGGATPVGFASAVNVAFNMAKNDLSKLISDDLKNYDEAAPVQVLAAGD